MGQGGISRLICFCAGAGVHVHILGRVGTLDECAYGLALYVYFKAPNFLLLFGSGVLGWDGLRRHRIACSGMGWEMQGAGVCRLWYIHSGNVKPCDVTTSFLLGGVCI